LDGIDLARNLLDHVVCLAWIAADPQVRLDLWLKARLPQAPRL
jgi:hypothetical protein